MCATGRDLEIDFFWYYSSNCGLNLMVYILMVDVDTVFCHAKDIRFNCNLFGDNGCHDVGCMIGSDAIDVLEGKLYCVFRFFRW